MQDGILVKQHVLEHVKEHVKVGEMEVEMEHVNAGEMEFEMEFEKKHGKMKWKRMQQE